MQIAACNRRLWVFSFLCAAIISAKGVHDTKPLVDVDAAPTGWTCTLRTAFNTTTATASCTGSEKAIEGGCDFVSGIGASNASYPAAQGWTCYDSNGAIVTAHVNCCQ